jgi:hypothetical protein
VGTRDNLEMTSAVNLTQSVEVELVCERPISSSRGFLRVQSATLLATQVDSVQ